MMVQFRYFKKSDSLGSYIVEINRLEGDGDELFIQGDEGPARVLPRPVEILTWSRMLDCLESCCDAMEDVADAVENIVMKNT
jgi:uncharacterized protein Yka (UPF0111/DUF47 family)